MNIRIEDTFVQETEALQPDERDRLLLAVVRYQMDGTEPDLTGNERFLWPVYRVRIDQEKAERQAKAEAGRKSGEARRNRNEQGANTIEQTANTIEQEGTDVFPVPAEKESTPEPLKEKESEKGDVPPEGPQTARAEKAEAERLFAAFWAAYPRKEDKKNACRAFVKLRPNEALLSRMLSAVSKQRASPQWQEAGGKYIPLASTWLHGERWEDQPSMNAGLRTVSAQMYGQRDYTEEELMGTSFEDLIAEAKALTAAGG